MQGTRELKSKCETNRGIGTAKAAETSMSTSIETKEGQDVDVKSVAHRLVLLIIHLKELHIWVHLCQLAYLKLPPTKNIKEKGKNGICIYDDTRTKERFGQYNTP